MRLSLSIAIVILASTLSMAQEPLSTVTGVETQPFKAGCKRVVQALEFLGEPLSQEQQAAFESALAEPDAEKANSQIQKILDQRCLIGVNINPESRVKVARGSAAAELNEQGWRVFLVKVHNEAGVTAKLQASSPSAEPLYQRSTGHPAPKLKITPEDVPNRFLEIQMYNKQPLVEKLSGLLLEYRVMQMLTREAGKREASIAFNVGQGSQDLGFRNEVPILFDCKAAVDVRLDVIDHDGKPTTGQFVFRDKFNRVYPARSRRLAPDFFFHDQVYRHDEESIALPAGDYEVTYTRGPEYRILKRNITVPAAKTHRESFRLQRWIKLADLNWYSGDHHVHAAGCAHYEAPTQGVMPKAMMRHILGEDLNVGCVLSWGPCWYHQKEFFDGKVHELSTKDYVMRYDVEVSGFPSSHAGHLCLLGLDEDDYPGTTKIEEWPSWDLPVLKWGKEQGGVVGFSHSGWGLQMPTQEIPSYDMPPFDGIGANEYIVDVTHGVCDFISSVDTPINWELNIWYHTLNCGYTCVISGETDFPCIYGDRVGLGRVYVKLDGKTDDSQLDFDSWLSGIKAGRSYCGDGLSHLIDFKINGFGMGEKGDKGRNSFLAVKSGEPLAITIQATALLDEKPQGNIRSRPFAEKPYWHVERARVGDTRKVPVELIVNGRPVETREIEADGSMSEIKFNYVPSQSSWIAVRILGTCHTNPIFVEVDGKPIRSSKRSAQWCLDAVDTCWKSKKGQIRKSERDDARKAYDFARDAYRKIIAESFDDAQR